MIEYDETNLVKIREVADTLQGTCKSLDDVLQEEFDADVTEMDIRLLQELDDITMECQVCNWWCETGELDDNQVCSDCA